MMRWLVVDRPGLERVSTNTDAVNTHMIAVNQKIGYSVAEVVVDVEALIDSLIDRLAVGRG
jgi:mycothiol synthase